MRIADLNASVDDGAGNRSWTHVHIGADGRVTITTRTVDSRGNGAEHTTTTDRGGNVISDTTKRVIGGKTQDSAGDGSDNGGDDRDGADDDDGGDGTGDDGVRSR